MTERAETKIRLSIGTIIVALSMVVACTSGFVVLKFETAHNGKQIDKHSIDDTKKWDSHDRLVDKIYEEVDSNKDKIHALELQNTRIETMLAQIKADGERRDAKIDHVIDILGSFEVAE